MSHQLFISYAHEDKVYADAVCHHLEAGGIRCWIAPRDISPSKDWAEEIIDAIGSAAIMVLIFSSSSNHSPQVRREIERAVHKGVNILPFRIEDVQPSKSMEYFISTQHWLDALTKPLERHLDKLLGCVSALVCGASSDCETLSREALDSLHTAQQGEAPRATEPQAPLLSASDLKFVEVQLAGYLGPVAKILVRNASRKAASPGELVRLLAEELDNDAERRSFTSNCRFLHE